MQPSSHIAELVARIQRKDVVAMKTVYEYFSQDMLSSSYRITNDRQASEDILQEAFLTSFQKINQLTTPEKYVGWLRQIVINNSLKMVKRKMTFVDIDAHDYSESPEESDWYKNIPFAQIQAAIQQLPDGARSVLSLYLLEGYQHKEIADILNIAVSTSKSQYRYGLKKLQAALQHLRYE